MTADAFAGLNEHGRAVIRYETPVACERALEGIGPFKRTLPAPTGDGANENGQPNRMVSERTHTHLGSDAGQQSNP